MASFQALGAPTEAAVVHIGLGGARVDVGDTELGRLDLLDAAVRLEGLGSTGCLPDVFRDLASAELSAGNLAAADRAGQLSLHRA